MSISPALFSLDCHMNHFSTWDKDRFISHDIEQARRIIKSDIVSFTSIKHERNKFFLFQIWKMTEPYLQKYLDWYQSQKHD